MTENKGMKDEAELLALIVQSEISGPFSVREITEYYTRLIAEGHGELIMPFLRVIESVVADARRHIDSELYDATHPEEDNQ